MFHPYHQSRSLNDFEYDEANLFDTSLDFDIDIKSKIEQ